MPHEWWKGTTTRSPFLKRFTSEPTSSTTPQYSCPSTVGRGGTKPIHSQPPCHRCQSERQIPLASTRRTASPGPHSGSFQSLVTASGFPNSSITAAFMAPPVRSEKGLISPDRDFTVARAACCLLSASASISPAGSPGKESPVAEAGSAARNSFCSCPGT